ncbi:MAG: HupE/UreJ protein [Rhodospirillaceae bacterium]|nr:MAG: HupE/UreJ protein [Rhodospirillaceae bacterium]
MIRSGFLLSPRATGAFAAAAVLVLGAPAYAHTGGGEDGVMAGFAHPFTGLDHMLAMVAVGLWAATQKGPTAWAAPATFITVMLAGFGAALAGGSLPLAEAGIAALAIVGLCALFHGHAHGTEMPLATDPLVYGGGFCAATALLHAIGFGAGRLTGQTYWARMGARMGGTRMGARAAGIAIAVAGIFMF